MSHFLRSFGMKLSQRLLTLPHWYLSVVDIHRAPKHPLGPGALLLARRFRRYCTPLTSISTKLGVGSSLPSVHPIFIAPVALPGLTKNFPSISYASNLCVPPHSKMSTSSCRAVINKLSGSPGGIIVWPCVKPIRSEPCVTTLESARLGASTSNSPLTICRSGAMARRNSNVSRSVRLPRQRIWPILPGVRSFLNCVRGEFHSRTAIRAAEVMIPLLVYPGQLLALRLGCTLGFTVTYRSSIWYEQVTQAEH